VTVEEGPLRGPEEAVLLGGPGGSAAEGLPDCMGDRVVSDATPGGTIFFFMDNKGIALWCSHYYGKTPRPEKQRGLWFDGCSLIPERFLASLQQ